MSNVLQFCMFHILQINKRKKKWKQNRASETQRKKLAAAKIEMI